MSHIPKTNMANINYKSETLYPHTPPKISKENTCILALSLNYRSLLQLSERWPFGVQRLVPAQRPSVNFYWKKVVTVGEFERWLCHIWPIDMMEFASLEANLGGGWDPLLSFLSPSFLEEPQTWLQKNWLGLFKSLSPSINLKSSRISRLHYCPEIA